MTGTTRCGSTSTAEEIVARARGRNGAAADAAAQAAWRRLWEHVLGVTLAARVEWLPPEGENDAGTDEPTCAREEQSARPT